MDIIEKWHGTAGGYSNHKCRCELCRVEWNRYCQERKARRRDSGYFRDPSVTHDSYVTYSQGCRCGACTDAASRYHRERKLARMNAPEPPADSVCECCDRVRDLVLDHDHEGGKFRGWICHSCNTGLGKLGDTIAGLRAAIKYLENH